ncbi:hypothetical protein FO519_006471 [Halicephalobus sp. NKZ332]|nr:hypothetical protein FO519_006471 [Halicephalobus sp. NKZ332]
MEPLFLPWLAAQIGKNYGCRKSESPFIKEEVESPQKPEFKLTFFDARGNAEMSRMILAFSGIPFEDRRVSFDEFKQMKKECHFAQLPMLEWNGKVIYESSSIARMLAKMNNLAGTTIFEQAQADSLIDILKEFTTAISEYLKFLLGLRSGDEEIFYNEILVPAVLKYFPSLEKTASESFSGFLLNSGVTYADFELTNTIETICNFHPSLMSNYPNLLNIANHVHNLPQLQSYFKNRPKTAL